MLQDLLTHQYFWLSFLPVVSLSIGFWILYLDRADQHNEPLFLLFVAVIAGVLAGMGFVVFNDKWPTDNIYLLIFEEEFFKMICAILAMEILQARFKHISQGIMYGFAVGLGFALLEDLVYLMRLYDSVAFDPEFWIVFQGRFWSSTLVHGITMAFFGMFYSSAYLSPTINKGKNESPLCMFCNLKLKHLADIATFHVARTHLLTKHEKDLHGHPASAVLWEGFLVAFLIHLIFNMALHYSMPAISFLLGIGGLWFLHRKSKHL